MASLHICTLTKKRKNVNKKSGYGEKTLFLGKKKQENDENAIYNKNEIDKLEKYLFIVDLHSIERFYGLSNKCFILKKYSTLNGL